MLSRFFFFKYYFIFSFCFISAFAEDHSWQKPFEEVCLKIQALENEKSRMEKKKLRHEEKALNCQFNRELRSEMKREYSLADQTLEKIRLIEWRLKELEIERLEILKELHKEP